MQIDFFKFQLHIQIDRPFNFKQHDNNLGDFFLLARLSSTQWKVQSIRCVRRVCETTEHENSSLYVALSTVFWVNDDAQTPRKNMFFTRDFSARLANFNLLLINIESSMVSLKVVRMTWDYVVDDGDEDFP